MPFATWWNLELIMKFSFVVFFPFEYQIASPEYYLTPAPNADPIRKRLLVGRHLIILNYSGH